MYDRPAYDMSAVLACAPSWREDDQAAEVLVLRQLEGHAARVHDPEHATLFVVPVLPYVSWVAGTCRGTTHDQRMGAAAAALRNESYFARHGGRDHLLVSNTFRIQAFKAFKPLLLRASIGWFEQPEASKLGPSVLYEIAKAQWRCTVVIPYLANPHCDGPAAATSNAERAPGSFFFQGAWGVAQPIRGRFALLQRMAGANVHDVARGQHLAKAAPGDGGVDGGGGADGGGAVARALPVDSSKLATARMMQRAEFCLAPRGDTPSSGRLFAAMQCGCVPLVISTHLPQHLPFLGQGVNYPAFLGQIPEAHFLCNPQRAIGAAIAALRPQLPMLRAGMRVAARDLLFDVPGSRVADRMLREWQRTCAVQAEDGERGA